jgi:AraC family transcriptional regulator
LNVQMMRPAAAEFPAGAQTPSRVIDDFELVWMLRGRARLVSDERHWSLVPGQLALVPPGVRHGFVWDEHRPCRHGYVHFEADHLAGAPVAEVRLTPMTADDPLDGLCAFLLWLGRSDRDDWQAPAERALRLVLALLVAGPLPPAEPPRNLPTPVSAATDHLRREWAQMPLRRVTVTELASAAAVSRGYLERLFRAAFGLGVAAGMERARCSRAEMLLTRTDLTLEVVARQCGFADGSHFSHRFTAAYGLPPSAYRRDGVTDSVLDDPGVRHLARLIWS